MSRRLRSATASSPLRELAVHRRRRTQSANDAETEIDDNMNVSHESLNIVNNGPNERNTADYQPNETLNNESRVGTQTTPNNNDMEREVEELRRMAEVSE